MTLLPVLAIGLVLGLGSSSFLSVDRPLAFVIGIGAVSLHLTTALVFRKHRFVPAIAAIIASCGVGLALGSVERWSVPAFKSGEHVLLGEVVRLFRGADERWFVALRLHGAAVVSKDGGAVPLVHTPSVELFLVLEEEAALRLRLKEVIIARARGVTRHRRRNFGDGRRASTSFAALVAGPMVVGDGSSFPISTLAETRLYVRDRLRQVVDDPEYGVVVAMVLGDRTFLERELVTSFRRTGTAHLLAVSGLHVTLVSLLFRWLVLSVLVWTPLVRRYRVAAPASTLAALVCWSYALLTGLAPPAFRAAVMTSAALSAAMVGRPTSSVRAICMAAVTLLMYDPSLVWNPGFQLSFAAVIALSSLGGHVAPRDELSSPILEHLRTMVCVLWKTVRSSCAASLATAPLVAHHFGLFSPLGVLVNSVAVPTMGVLLPGMIVVALVSSLSVDCGRLVSTVVVEIGLELFLAALRWVNGLSSSCLSVSRPALHEALLLALAGGLVMRASRRAKMWAVVLMIAAATSWAVRLNLSQGRGTLHVTFLDVGAGDATLVELPEGGRMLIDAGPREGDLGRSIDVVTALQRRGFGQVDLFALTHGHSDHASGARSVLTDVGAERYWSPMVGDDGGAEASETRATVERLQALARRRGVHVEEMPSMCGVHRIGGLRLEVLHPCRRDARSFGENDRSLVIRLVYRQVAVLLPGDIEAPAEAMILRRRHLLRATVLKLPHHGSDSSSSDELLDAVDPTIAVASCGRSRRHLLPHPDVASRLRRRGTLVLSTSELGAIRVSTEGRRLRISSARVGDLDFF